MTTTPSDDIDRLVDWQLEQGVKRGLYGPRRNSTHPVTRSSGTVASTSVYVEFGDGLVRAMMSPASYVLAALTELMQLVTPRNLLNRASITRGPHASSSMTRR